MKGVKEIKSHNILLLLLLLLLILSTVSVQAEKVHRVSAGEDLFNLAEQYGLTVNEIINNNNLLNPNNIFKNQVIIIPDTQRPGLYRVQNGDTLYKISQKLNIPISVLVEENKLIYKNQLYTKQPLSIPLRYRYPQIYQVKAGNSIYKIASKFEVSIEEIMISNKLNDYSLDVNQKLKIPVLKKSKPYKGPQYYIRYPNTLYYKGKSNTNQVALTFDDGPDSYYTERVLEILKDHDIPATFFLVGSNINIYPDVVKKIVEDGHVIASHSWSHPDLYKLNKEELILQIKDTEKAIKDQTDVSIRFIRPPWGFVSDMLIQTAQEMNYKIVNWNVDSIDWRDQNVDQILINTIPNISNDSIILFHSAGGRDQNLDATINVLPELIETLKMNGYSFVTVDELLQTPAYEI